MPQCVVPGLVRAPTLAEMEFEQRPLRRPIEPALDAIGREFAGRFSALMTEIDTHHECIGSAAKNSVSFSSAGYGLYRLGMKIGELCRAWLRDFHDDQGVAPSVESLSATAQGIHQMGQQNWLPALHSLGGVAMQQPRFRDAIQNFGKCAEAMAAYCMGRVGHLPNADQFRQKIAQGLSEIHSLDQKLDVVPNDPVVLEKSRNICNQLVEASDQWLARSREFVPADKSTSDPRLIQGAGAALLRQDARAALQEFGGAVFVNPSFEAALRGLLRSAQIMADTHQRALDKVDQELREAIWLADYSRRMDQHYAFIDDWSAAARSPEVNSYAGQGLLKRGAK